jgi:aspartate aminotransferase
LTDKPLRQSIVSFREFQTGQTPASVSARLDFEMYATRLDGIHPSPIAMISDHARKLRALGNQIIDLGVGEPDFDTPEFIKAAAVEALARGETKYTATNGSTQLREAICEKFRRENGLNYELNEVAVSSGAKQIIFNAMMATLNDGDEVIVPAPYWASYPDMIRIAGGQPVIVPCSAENGFRLAPGALEDAIGPRTKWLFLNSPNNPTGAAYDAEQLSALASVLLRYPHIWILSDDIYEHLLYGESAFVTIAQVEPSLRERTVTMNGVSKTYAMTGWRLGYAGAPEAMIKAMTNVQTQSTTHASSISQAGALAALNGPQGFIAERTQAFRARRDLVVRMLADIPGVRCNVPDGAFYVFPSCEGLLGKKRSNGDRLETDVDVARFLLEEASVSTVPGTMFGMAPFVRISTAADEDQLRTACARISEACKGLQ